MAEKVEDIKAENSMVIDVPMRHQDIKPDFEEISNEKLKRFVLKSEVLKESISEFLATFLLVFLGDSVIAALTFTRAGTVSLAAAPLGWGLALLVAVAVTGGASGCHANPAITLAFASIGKTKWSKVGPYFLAQYLGAFVAACLVFAVYYDSILNYDGGMRNIPPHVNATAQIFATYPPIHVSLWGTFLDQVVGTAVLALSIVAVVDPRNLAIYQGLYPLTIGLVLAAIVHALPYNCGAPLNPARDLAPRLFTFIAGYGTEVFSHRGYGYFAVPFAAPHLGAIIGAWLYKLSIEIHLPENEKALERRNRAGYGSTEKLIEDEDELVSSATNRGCVKRSVLCDACSSSFQH